MEIPLSLVLAVYNEQENLADCLKSVQGLAGEIIVVDGGSTDNTRKIAQKFGAKIYRAKNPPIFHLNKQLAVDKAEGRWILQLDADERLTPALIREIKAAIKQPQFAGFYLPRKNWFLTRFLTKGGQYPDYVIRLFRRGKGRFPCQSVHEQIAIAGPVGYLTNPLIHLADRRFSHYVSRWNRYTSLDADRLFELGVKPGLFVGLNYLMIKPWAWFFSTYFRHKGLVDGWPGFIFSLMSALRFPVIYFKLWEKYYAR
jgi:glycosyltransferase involved in cell wall biosynthesis